MYSADLQTGDELHLDISSVAPTAKNGNNTESSTSLAGAAAKTNVRENRVEFHLIGSKGEIYPEYSSTAFPQLDQFEYKLRVERMGEITRQYRLFLRINFVSIFLGFIGCVIVPLVLRAYSVLTYAAVLLVYFAFSITAIYCRLLYGMNRFVNKFNEQDLALGIFWKAEAIQELNFRFARAKITAVPINK